MKFIKYLFIFSLVSFVAVLGISIFFKKPVSPTSSYISTPTPILNNPDQCIIAIYGQKYNITDYIYQHPGGNTFNCGTDMTAAFSNQHPNGYLQRIARYKVN